MIQKEEKLKQNLIECKKLAVAFSSGVDSTYLLKVAHDMLGENVLAITATSSVFPLREKNEAIQFCVEHGIRHILVEVNELEIPGFCENPKDRCYLCKKDLFTKMIQVANEQGFDTVAEASNMDDLGDYRPGMRAIKELSVMSPLREVGLTKAEIRELSQKLLLPTWKKPSYACLASRFVYGEQITKEKLSMVEKAEQLLMDMGFYQVRVRIHENLARIEVLDHDLDKVMKKENRLRITEEFKKYGFSYVSLDLQGYRTGSMNETLSEQELKIGKI